jgi:hypothetical protein
MIVPLEVVVSTGVKVNCTAQEAAGAIAPQLWATVTTDSDEVMELNCRGALPQFVTFTDWDVELFASTAPKLMEVVFKQTEGAGVAKFSLLMNPCGGELRGLFGAGSTG